MVAWTGIEHFRMGRYDPPPPPQDPEDFVVSFASNTWTALLELLIF